MGWDNNEEVYLMDPDGGGRVRLTTQAGVDSRPGWQPQPIGNRPPDCAGVLARPRSLWPANHKLHPVTVSGASDPDGDPVTLAITHVRQDEPVDGRADGSTAPDARRTADPGRVLLRVERSRKGDGRVYRVGFRATDPRGASCTGVARVDVPRTKRRSAVDSGLRVNSFGAAWRTWVHRKRDRLRPRSGRRNIWATEPSRRYPMPRLIRMDSTGHSMLGEWTPGDQAAYDAAVDAFRREAAAGYIGVVSEGEGRATQVSELPREADLVLMRRPIAGG
ncbi:MAG: hypothetical protein M3N16_05045 [Actinomycetota bacterium]|nr:hypothetical protein [Actinomycetota bacterium]